MSSEVHTRNVQLENHCVPSREPQGQVLSWSLLRSPTWLRPVQHTKGYSRSVQQLSRLRVTFPLYIYFINVCQNLSSIVFFFNAWEIPRAFHFDYICMAVLLACMSGHQLCAKFPTLFRANMETIQNQRKPTLDSLSESFFFNSCKCLLRFFVVLALFLGDSMYFYFLAN